MKKILICLVLIITISIVSVAIFFKVKLDKINYEKIATEDIEINEGIDEILTGYTNIALLGLDTLDETFENSRSDCIMIISINNDTKEVKVVSVYRDTYLNIEEHGLDKVTHAHAYGKVPLALSTINTNLDLNITRYVTINFKSVINIVDAIGGVEIEISSAEATQISGIDSAGTYNLTGEQALQYGRIRAIDNDYARTERMRTVVIKVFEKAKELSYMEIYSMIDKLLPEITTNIKQTEILAYAAQMANYNVTDSFGWPYNVKGYSGAAWYAVPVTLEENVKKLHEELFENKEYEVSETVKQISKDIINKTGKS